MPDDTSGPRVRAVTITDEVIAFALISGQTVSVPLAWSWRLSEATPEQRTNFEVVGDGQGVHWPDSDEDLSVQGMLTGVPARRPSNIEQPIPVGSEEYTRSRQSEKNLDESMVAEGGGRFPWETSHSSQEETVEE